MQTLLTYLLCGLQYNLGSVALFFPASYNKYLVLILHSIMIEIIWQHNIQLVEEIWSSLASDADLAGIHLSAIILDNVSLSP